jgi:hypothetical protein
MVGKWGVFDLSQFGDIMRECLQMRPPGNLGGCVVPESKGVLSAI